MDEFKVIKEHECKTLKNQEDMAVQKSQTDHWYLIDYERCGAYGIGYCPYCGEELD